jgi:hypothetical protein
MATNGSGACTRRSAGLLAAVLLGAAGTAGATGLDAWLDASVECLQSLAGFNEERPWLQLRFEDDRTTVLVESGGRDGVLVALSCGGGGFAEGDTFLVPAALSGGADLPDERLPRERYDRGRLADLVETGRRLTGARTQAPASMTVTAVMEPRDTVLTTVTFGEPTFRTVTFDADGREVADSVPAIADWAPPPVENRTSLGIETPIRSTPEVVEWLKGALGGTATIHRFIIDQGMVTVAYDDASAGYVLQQWFVDEGNLSSSGAASPISAELAELYVRCARPPRASELPGAFAKLAPRLGKRLESAMMLVLECRNDARKPIWELLGGDGIVVEGQPLRQDQFPFER